MAKKASTTKTETTTPALNEQQVAEVRQIVSDYLTNDEFDISLPQDAVIDACKAALKDKAVATELAALLK